MHLPKIIKTFSKNSDASNFAQGNIILRCLNYFRMCEDERGDNSESTVKYSNQEGITTITTFCNDALILSLWTPPSNWRKEGNKFGKYHVEITNPCALFSEIQASLKNILFQDNNAYFGKIDYMDYGNSISNPQDLNKVLEKVTKSQFYCQQVYLDSESPKLEGTLGTECNFKKDIKFQDEKESRMVFLIKLDSIKCLLNKHGNIQVKLWKKEIEYAYTDISFTTITKTTHFSDYGAWKEDRYSREKKYHWVEVILSNLPTKFFKLLD